MVKSIFELIGVGSLMGAVFAFLGIWYKERRDRKKKAAETKNLDVNTKKTEDSIYEDRIKYLMNENAYYRKAYEEERLQKEALMKLHNDHVNQCEQDIKTLKKQLNELQEEVAILTLRFK